MKEIIAAERKPYPYNSLNVYPQAPAELPEEMPTYAYDSNDPPEALHIPGLDVIANNKMIMRKNNCKLQSTGSPSPVAPKHATESQSPLATAVTLDDLHAALKRDRDDDADTLKAKLLMLGVKLEPLSPTSPTHVKAERPSEPCAYGSSNGVAWGVVPMRGRFDEPPGSGGAYSACADGSVTAEGTTMKRPAGAPKSEHEIDADADGDDGALGTVDDEESQDGLDDYSKAAIAALKLRDDRKKVDAAAKKTAAKAEAAAAGAVKPETATGGKTTVKAEAAKGGKKAVKVEPKVKIAAAAGSSVDTAMKKPAACKPTVMKKPVLVIRSKAQSMPTPGKGNEAPPNDYKGFRLYWKINRMAFRVIRNMPEYETETSIKRKGPQPTKNEWESALSAIDSYKK